MFIYRIKSCASAFCVERILGCSTCTHGILYIHPYASVGAVDFEQVYPYRLDKMLRDARKLYHRLSYTVDEENRILKKLDSLKAFPGSHDVPTPACFEFMQANMEECIHIILTPLPALRQEAKDIYVRRL